MSLQTTLTSHVQAAVAKIYDAELPAVELQGTRKEFDGEVTVVVFPMLRVIKGNPVQIGTAIGEYLVESVDEVTAFNVVKGFLNLVIADGHYIGKFAAMQTTKDYGKVAAHGKATMVEYSSPNTNKPLHLGHVRNVLLGFSVSEIIKASGSKVYKTQIINDRGIHICKSMLAWKRFGNGETPASTGLKGDKLVGKYYVMFESKMKKEAEPIFENYINDILSPPTVLGSQIKAYNNLIKICKEKKEEALKEINFENVEKLGNNFLVELTKAITKGVSIKPISKEIISSTPLDKRDSILKLSEKFEKELKPILDLESKIAINVNKIYKFSKDRTDLYGSAQEMLLKWEAGDEEVVALWKMMNEWVYAGFEVTYKNIGVDFDSYYYESNTYLLGKDNIEEGLKSGVFEQDPDGSVWCDLTEDGLDRKIVLRADGTAVYMTQDIGTAIQRIKDHPDVGGLIYTVGNEQDYHFKVLFLILKKLGFDWAENLFHLSYGMVDLPSGKMKSREGTVVDADDLMEEMTATAKKICEEKGKLEGYSDQEKKSLYKMIGLGALKYYILKVDPQKRILFNPEESVDFQGNTGPFIQYTYARIQSILRKAKDLGVDTSVSSDRQLHPKEKELLKLIQEYPATIQLAAAQKSPAIIANYTYDVVKEFNSFYQQVQILGTDDPVDQGFRVVLSEEVGKVIKSAFGLLGIAVPERM